MPLHNADSTRNITPEHSLLLLCARPRLDEAAARRIRELIAAGVDWAGCNDAKP